MSTILVAADATARSEDAVALARRLAATGESDVVVATVTPADHPNRDEAHAIVRRMSGLLVGIVPERIRTAVLSGRSPAEALHQLATTESASLIVVGSTHRVRLGRVQPGGTGERVVLGSPCAVALAPHGSRSGQDRPVRRIGVAYDGSTESSAAFAAAFTAARAHDAVLEVITVISPEEEDAALALRRAQRQALADLPDGVAVEPVELEGRPASALAERSATLDLLFVGSRGWGPLRAVFTGGTSGPLLREAHCPVIVLPRGAEAPVAGVFDRPETVSHA